MKIVYVGNFKHTWCTEVHVARDAERIPGVEVVRVQEPREASNAFLRVIETAARDADLLIYQRTWGLSIDAIDLWRKLEARGCRTISYHLDLYRGLQREKGVIDDPFWRTGVVFTADGDPETTSWLANHGIDHRWMPAAVVSDECVMHDVPMGPLIVFVGSSGTTYHDEWPWRGELIAGLTERYGEKFFRWPTETRGRLHGRELSLVYQGAACVVGDSLALPGHTNYWSDRFYETVGRGGFLIGPRVPGIEQHFRDGAHLALYDLGDFRSVCHLIDTALAVPRLARGIAEAGQEHVRAHHTYRHRVQAILDSLGLVV